MWGLTGLCLVPWASRGIGERGFCVRLSGGRVCIGDRSRASKGHLAGIACKTLCVEQLITSYSPVDMCNPSIQLRQKW